MVVANLVPLDGLLRDECIATQFANVTMKNLSGSGGAIAPVRPLIGDLKFLIHRPHLFSTSTRFAITPLFHTAHAQKINFDLSF